MRCRIGCKAKLKSNCGETITEVLVASLVIAFASILLASMVVASTRIIKKSIEAYHLYTERHNAIEMLSISGDSIYMGNLTVGGGIPENITDENHKTVGYLTSDKDISVLIEGRMNAYDQGSFKNTLFMNETISNNLNVDIYTVSNSIDSSVGEDEARTRSGFFSKYFVKE